MNRHLKIIVALCFLATSLSCGQTITMRIVPHGGNAIICIYHNTSASTFPIPGYFLANDNNIGWSHYKENTKQWSDLIPLGPSVDFVRLPQNIVLSPNESRIEYIGKQQLMEMIPFLDRNTLGKLCWHLDSLVSGTILIGCHFKDCKFEPQDNLAGFFESMNMAFVFAESEENYILLRFPAGKDFKGDYSFSFEINALSGGHTNKLSFVTSDITTNAPAASVWHWRIPWNDIWNRLPEEDRARLEMAGEVDLRWKCGDLVSDPLPLWVGPVDESEMPEEWKGF